MNTKTTYVWGVCADTVGHVQHSRVEGERLPGGGLRAWEHVETAVEPATAYASVHASPMPMRWHHGEDIGQVVALRKAHGRLHAVARCDLEPADLQLLTDNHGDLKWSTSTYNRRRDPLKITEISLTPVPASVALPPVRWWKLDVVKGNLPPWVKEELDRADKIEYRSRSELRVHNVEPVVPDAADEYERLGIDLGMLPPGGYERRYEKIPIEYSRHPGRIISVR